MRGGALSLGQIKGAWKGRRSSMLMHIDLHHARRLMLALAMLFLLLPGCSPGGRGVPLGTVTPETQKQSATFPGSTPMKPSGGGPAAPNQSLVAARVLSMAPDSQNASATRVQALLLASTPVAGKLDFTRGLVGQNIVLLVRTRELTSVRVGDIIRASVTFVGDEHGGMYHASDVQKTTAPYP